MGENNPQQVRYKLRNNINDILDCQLLPCLVTPNEEGAPLQFLVHPSWY